MEKEKEKKNISIVVWALTPLSHSPLGFLPSPFSPPPAPLGSPDARLGFCLLPAAAFQRARPRGRERAVLSQPCRCARASGSRCGGTATRWRLTRRRGGGGARTIWWRSARTAARRASSRGAVRGSRPRSLPLPRGSRRRWGYAARSALCSDFWFFSFCCCDGILVLWLCRDWTSVQYKRGRSVRSTVKQCQYVILALLRL